MSGEKSFDLTKVHEVNLKLLKEIDRICRKYKIKYALDSGTLLGAVRHGGFIPWDDDVDVMFTRKNYEMFAKVVRRELPEDMSFVEPNEYHGGKAFYDFISRVTYNKSQKFEDSGKMEFYGQNKISRLTWSCSSWTDFQEESSRRSSQSSPTAFSTDLPWDTGMRSITAITRAL